MKLKVMCKNLVIGVLLSCGVFMWGCSVNPKGQKQDINIKESKDEVKLNKINEDLKKEQEVIDGKISINENIVSGAIIAKEDANIEEVKKMAEKYAKQLKKEYKDMKVNVQAVKGGENIANVTID